MRMNRTPFCHAAMWVLLVAPWASAQTLHPQLDPGAPSPWAQGVSQERQAAAAALFKEANDYYEKALFVKAAELYRSALEQWDHPAAHYNLALALMDTGQKLELREHLEAATRYGPKPLDEKLFEHASKLKGFVEKQLVRVEVSCDVPGASVRMNERVLLTGVGRFNGWVLPGSHVFVTTQEGFPPNERIRKATEGETISLHISQVYGDEQLTRYRRPWSAWKPWAVLGAGVAVAAGGGALHSMGRSDIQDFDARAAACGLGGCPMTPALDSLQSRGERFQRVAVGTYAAGGALVVTGAILAFINRAEPYRLSPDEYEQEVKVAVQVGPDTRALLVAVQF